MRDGVKLARRGVPAIALVTTEFWAQGDFIARSVGIPDVPRVELPHPVAGTGIANMAMIAETMAPKIVAAWRGHQ